MINITEKTLQENVASLSQQAMESLQKFVRLSCS